MTGRDWARQWRDSRPTRWAIAGGAFLAMLVLATTLFVILETRAKEIADSKRELMTLNLSLAEQTARAIQGVDLILGGIVDQVKADGVESAEDFERVEAGSMTYRQLKARAADVPQLDAVTMIAADGHLINFSRYYPIPTVNVADRDYFQALRDTATSRPYLSAPVENRGTGTWTLYVARRISDPSGRFVGLVLGAINLSYFEDLYKALQLGPGSGISLWRRDGILLARYPSIEGIGKIFQIKSFTETLLHSDVGVYETAASIDGYSRIVATRALRDYPMVVNVTRSLDDILADWRQTSSVIGVAGILCALAVALVAWALARQFGTYESLSRALGEKAEAVLARERAEGQLYQSQKLDAVGQLTTGIAHDFNNLLTAIMGNLEFLNFEKQSARTERSLAAIQKAVDRAATLTGQLLAFSRKQHLSPEAVDLNGLIGNMTEMLRSTLGGTIRVELALRADLWRALVDPVQIELVVLNLAINARDAMPAGGVLTIATDNAAIGEPVRHDDLPAGEYVLISVGDTGTGMTDDVLARAFDPFFTTKPPGKGTGLGLSQVYGMVQQSSGGIRIETAVDQGTIVRIYLPRIVAATAEAPIVTPAPTASMDPRPTRILVVDDDPSVRETVAEMVDSLGFSVLSAENGHQALDHLAADRSIDLVITDFAMPELNGAEVARCARHMRPGLPIIFVTGFADVESLRGEAWVLQKPFRRDGLAAKLRLALPGQVADAARS
ncbi:MAG TPA: cache domain-containing protein [Aliidongia sp.]|uniref:hybrid sensor histidine kinase/response regulator n=1 Tax=Aliidongia sp. TaxID=1914230 RepID=UPI002DDD1DD8|nr:cache domain-containing protein [Aliidongia sp.]HEV2676025.1 cache domain-containing protein [Aliidongia sp.]